MLADMCIPGVIRRLALNESLRKDPEHGWHIDLTKLKHKTSRSHSPEVLLLDH